MVFILVLVPYPEYIQLFNHSCNSCWAITFGINVKWIDSLIGFYQYKNSNNSRDEMPCHMF